MRLDILAYLVILIDLFTTGFLLWRVSVKKATIDIGARLVYIWIALIYLYHATIYIFTLFQPDIRESIIIYNWIHPLVALYVLNPLLVAIIHYRHGSLL
jgi:hypothetical protein